MVDYDIDEMLLLKESLKEMLTNFDVNMITDANECIEQLFYGYEPDIVFIDINMQCKNGTSCLQVIQQQQLLPKTPIIIYTDSQEQQDIRTASVNGARLYLIKPPTYSLLVQMVERVLFLLGRPLAEQHRKENFLLEYKITVPV